MRILPGVFLIAVIAAACGKDKGSAGRKPHDPVKGPALWTVHIDELAIQSLDDSDQPKGEVHQISARPDGTYGCRLEVDPGNEAIAGWVTGSIDEGGKLRMQHSRDESAPDNVIGCAMQPIVNTMLTSTPGEYKVTFKVAFSDPKPQPQ